MSSGYNSNIEFTKEYSQRYTLPKSLRGKKIQQSLNLLMLLYGSSHYDVKSLSAGKQIMPSETKQIKEVPKVANVNLKL